MGQPGIAQGDGRWYLITSYGDLVVRVHPDMAVGESAAGELSFDPTCAQLTLDIEDDGGLVLKAVDDHELESAGGPRCRKAHLARHRRAEVHLPHNIIRIDTDFVNLAPTDDSVAILTVRPMGASTKPSFEPPPEGLPEEPLDPGLEARPPQRATSRSAHRDENSTPDTPPVEPMHGIPLPLRKPLPEQFQQPGRIQQPEQIEQPQQTEQIQQIQQTEQIQQIQQIETVEQTDTRRQRALSPLMAGLIGLAAVSFALLLYVALREDPVTAPPPATVDAGPAPSAEPAAASSANPTPSLPLSLPASEAPPATKPDDGDRVADRLFEPSPEPGPVAEPVVEPITQPVAEPVAQQVAQPDIELIELPLAERRSMPPIEPTIAQALAANETAAGVATIDSSPDAPVAEEPKAIDRQADTAVVVKAAELSEQAQAQDSEQDRRRTLRAADVALEQGRLTTPPEASAYTLYNKVLALDPDSPEARSGLQSVRQGLINRALAELASDALDDARTSLQAAADTGANPMLVADLLREVDYRQQLINAQGGARQSP